MEDLKRDFKGIWIPKEIWESTDLTAIEKVIYAELNSLCGEDGCYASNEYLSKFCQCSVPTVTRTITKLKRLGYIESIQSDGRNRVIKMIKVIKMISLPNHDDESASSNRLDRVITVISRENNILNTRDNNILIPPIVPHDFDTFWNAYPKKVGKKDAEKAFKKVKVSLDTLLIAIEQQKQSEQWSKENGKYIPNPSTWLNGEKWNDELSVQKTDMDKTMEHLRSFVEGSKR